MPRIAAVMLVLLLVLIVLPFAPQATAGPLTGFREEVAFNGLINPTAIRFAPDGRIFVAEKRGVILAYDNLSDRTATQVADLRTEVYNFWDRGLLGLAIDPGFPTRPYIYALYTYDGDIGGPAPRWGSPGADSDPCPTPPGANTDGCVVSGKLAKLTLTGNVMTSKQDLIHDWCQQYPSHSVGDMAFGADGALYVTGGDGASFTFTDYGQEGIPVNPCNDPGGTAPTPPSAEGGSLRSQDIRTRADPASLDGTVIRVNPDTGAGLPDNPGAASSDPNVRRIVAAGLRNPFRMTVRPGSNDVWVGDVGYSTWEEINRIPNPTGEVRNFGWPCYEGDDANGPYGSAGLRICSDLYAGKTTDVGNAPLDPPSQTGHIKPFFKYRHGQDITSGEDCNTAHGSSTSGLTFQFYSGGPYPAQYDGALFLADYSRGCIWVMTKGGDGLPDKLAVEPFVEQAAAPVNLQMSPAGELFYVDFDGGTIRRIIYGSAPPDPTTCPTGQYRTEYFDNKALIGPPQSTVCEAAPLNHDWGQSGPAGVGVDNFSARWLGTFDFVAGPAVFSATADDGIRVWVDGVSIINEWRDQGSTTFTATRSMTAGAHEVKVEYFDSGYDAVAKVSWTGGGTGSTPQPQITSPAATTTWKVGDTITFSGTATDAEDGTLPASRLSWQALVQHCPDACHTHVHQSWEGMAGASFSAPDHEYPSHLELRLTATDSNGNTTSVTRRLDPKTVPITTQSQPAGLQLTFGQTTAVTPFTTTVIVGSTNSVSAPSPQTLSGTSYAYTAWSDGGGQTHNITAGATAATYTATYTPGGGTACPAGQYRVEYFANKTLGGTPASSACEAAPLDHDWGLTSPAGVGPDNFSARWTGTFDFVAGTSVFTARADDGIRVWVDGVVVIDQWKDQGATTYTATRTMTAGPHPVRVEYYDSGASAVAEVSWTGGGSSGPACPAGQYRVEYFANKTLGGTPASSACEAAPLDHDWGLTSPAGVGPDNFSARWTGTFDFVAGVSVFTARADDGIRVWVDGVVVIDQWKDQGATTYTASRSMTAGAHSVRVEYYDSGASAVAEVSWTGGGSSGPACPAGQYRVEYFANKTLGGTPASSACEAAPLDHDWGLTSPGGVGPDNFSARWTGTFDFVAGVSVFTARADDGIRVWVDGVVVIDQWKDQGATTYTATRTMTAGPHPVRVEYYDSGASAVAEVSWTGGGSSGPACPAGQYRVEYFANKTLGGTPASSACEAAPLDHDWGLTSPAGVGPDNFSARWTGTFDFVAGASVFTARADDGIRVWVDGVVVIDQWKDQGATTYTATRTMTAGPHPVRVEYYDSGASAVAEVSWTGGA